MPFSLNGTAYTKPQLLQLAQAHLVPGILPLWQHELFTFIAEWLNEESYITVNTSGSTGVPKTIRLPKNKVRNSALMTGRYLALGEGSTALLSLSASYIAGKMMIVRAIENHWQLWATKPTSQPLSHIAPNLKVDIVAWVPSQLQAMLQTDSQLLIERIQGIGTILLGGSPVLPQLADTLRHFPNRVFETFGMTETISHIAMKRLSGKTATSLFETTDPDIILGQDERDCLVVIAPALTDHPVITNDIVELRNERHFVWLGRVDNVVNSGGIKLFPETLELKIQPLLAQRFFLAGVPDAQLGQKLVLVLESPALATADLELLRKSLTTVLTRYEMPRNIYTVAQLAETATHKINRPATLRQLGL